MYYRLLPRLRYATRWQRKLRLPRLWNFQRVEDAEIAVYAVLSPHNGNASVVEKPCPFSRIVQADNALRAQRPGNQRTAQQALQIQDDIGLFPFLSSQFSQLCEPLEKPHHAADTSEFRAWKNDGLGDAGIVGKQRCPTFVNYPRDAALGRVRVNGRRDRQGVNHIAHRTGFDDDETTQR